MSHQSFQDFSVNLKKLYIEKTNIHFAQNFFFLGGGGGGGGCVNTNSLPFTFLPSSASQLESDH